MIQNAVSFNHAVMVPQYIQLYEKMLERPPFCLIKQKDSMTPEDYYARKPAIPDSF
jgi:hypothetical protein